jgi:hypothetical protein
MAEHAKYPVRTEHTSFAEVVRPRTRRGDRVGDRGRSVGVVPEALVAFATLVRAHASLVASVERALRKAGIDDWGVTRLLVLLAERRRALSVGEVAWWLGVSAATSSRIFDRAEAFGLVVKCYPERIDRRETKCRPTAKGCGDIEPIAEVTDATCAARLGREAVGPEQVRAAIESCAVPFDSRGRGYG